MANLKRFGLLFCFITMALLVREVNARNLRIIRVSSSTTTVTNTTVANNSTTQTTVSDSTVLEDGMSDSSYVLWMLVFILMFVMLSCYMFRGCIH